MSNNTNEELEQLKEAFSKGNKNILKEVASVAAVIKEGLLDNQNKYAKRLPEAVFVTYFLPRFAGEVVPDDKPWIRDWVAIAGSAMAEVVIVDEANKELYAIPPIMDTSFINLAPKDFFSPTLHGAVTQSLRIAANTPTAGQQHLDEALVKKIDDVFDPTLNKRSENEQRWLSIFDRYGIKTKDDSSAAQKPTEPDGMSSMLEYD